MGRALYRKYRSRSLDELVGQEHIVATLRSALKKGAISHAYLFTGPRGVGKTSVARILAHEVNGLEYDEDATNLDIIEIDAASNRRIDEIRTLRERVNNAPASAKYKVYIIDAVHMLTREAFNALLKTLEEPPAHAIFILATTEAHKLPETIVSRTQRFTFKPVEQDKAVAHLRYIATEEGIDINDEALNLVAEHGGGSFRDSISLLDQLGSSGAVIDLAATQRMLGIAPADAIQKILAALQQGSAAALAQQLTDLYAQGFQATQLAKQLSQGLRKKLLAQDDYTATDADLLRKLLDVPTSHDPNALLEIILLDVVLARNPQAIKEIPVEKVPSPPPEVVVVEEEQPPAPEPPKPEPEAKPEADPDPQPKPTTPPADLDPEEAWQQTLQTLKKKHNTLYGVARMAEPMWEGDKLTLVFNFAFHQKRLDESKNKTIIRDILYEQTGHGITLNCVVEKKPTDKPTKAKPADKDASGDPLETITNIFGDTEVLE